jgi:uncharacterized membrane protein
MSDLLRETVEALRNVPREYAVLIISALPVFEVRGGVIAGLLLGLPVRSVLLYGCLGNFASVTPALLFLEPLSKWLYGNRFADRIFHWLFTHARKKADQVNRWGVPGLTVLTSIPLPGFGAWTAVIIAVLIGMHRWRALAATYLGIVISAVIVAVLTLGGMAGVDHLRGTP